MKRAEEAAMIIWKELRYGMRALIGSPATSIVAVLALGLGIGVNVTSFTSTQALVLHPFPYPELGRIMTVWDTPKNDPDNHSSLSPANFSDWARLTRSFQSLAALKALNVSLTRAGDATRVPAAAVTPEFFQVLGIKAIAGRTLRKARADEAVAVVDESFANEHLAGVRTAPGKTVRVDGKTYSIIGVVSSKWAYPLMTQIWLPLNTYAAEVSARSNHDWQVIGRLRPEVSIEQAQRESERIAEQLAREYPEVNSGRSLRVVAIAKNGNEVTERFLVLLLISALFVLLLAAANVANVQMARTVARQKEIALRAAMGASFWQLARQFMIETLLMACLGSLLALILGAMNLQWTKATLPERVYFEAAGLRYMHMDAVTALYAIGLAIVAGVLASLPAIWRLLRQIDQPAFESRLQAGARIGGSSIGGNRLQRWLVGYEVAMALVLLIGASFLVKSFRGILHENHGYDAQKLLRMEVALPQSVYSDNTSIIQFYERALQHLSNVPGVSSGAVWSQGPNVKLRIEGRPAPQPSEWMPELEPVSASFLSTMGIALQSGRFVGARDTASAPAVAVISRAVAKHFWPHRTPLGSRIQLGSANSPWITVIGVSGDIVEDWFTNMPARLIYVPHAQHPLASVTLLMRTDGDPSRLGQSARSAMMGVDPDVAPYDVESMQHHLENETTGFKAAADAMSIYATVALLLAVTGIFGVLSYFVTQRRRDIGVRIALGAKMNEIMRFTMVRSLGPVFVGGLIGLALAYWLMRAMSSLLYGTVVLDGWTFLGGAAVILVTAVLASYLPARRATRIDPITALREN